MSVNLVEDLGAEAEFTEAAKKKKKVTPDKKTKKTTGMPMKPAKQC